MADEGDKSAMEPPHVSDGSEAEVPARAADRNAKPTWAQVRYLIRGLKEPGGKLPLFDDEGQEIDLRTIRSCIARGWAQPWFANPVKPDWLVCKLTPAGYRILGADQSKESQ